MGEKTKYERWREEFFTNFVHVDYGNPKGSFIPVQDYNYSTGERGVGDGTCNMATFLCWLILEKNYKVIKEVLKAIGRLEDSAYEFFEGHSPIIKEEGKYDGFFLRDDLFPGTEWMAEAGWTKTTGAASQLVSMENEDPCYSPFVSQDQAWNLSPMLLKLMCDGDDPKLPDDDGCSDEAAKILLRINSYIRDNGYTVYNPYLSWIKHYYEYLPPFATDYYSRQAYREQKFKMSVKVKRGANNWYYSGGTKAMCASAEKGYADDGGPSIRTWAHKAVVLFLDRVWEPILGLLGKEFKHNSYYCYGPAIWYSKKYGERLGKKFNESIQRMKDGAEYGEPFEWNVAYIWGKDLDAELVRWWADNYPEPKREGWAENPSCYLAAEAWLNTLQ